MTMTLRRPCQSLLRRLFTSALPLCLPPPPCAFRCRPQLVARKVVCRAELVTRSSASTIASFSIALECLITMVLSTFVPPVLSPITTLVRFRPGISGVQWAQSRCRVRPIDRLTLLLYNKHYSLLGVCFKDLLSASDFEVSVWNMRLLSNCAGSQLRV